VSGDGDRPTQARWWLALVCPTEGPVVPLAGV